MFIAVTGYGSTGASAYVDLLREFSDIHHIKEEFPLLIHADGLIDLRNAICSGNRLQVQVALLRFKNNMDSKRVKGLNNLTSGKYCLLTQDYFSNVANVCWLGSCVDDPIDLEPWYKKQKYKVFREIVKTFMTACGRKGKWPAPRMRYYSTLHEEEFNFVTKNYLRKLFQAFGVSDNENVLVEQVFSPVSPTAGMEFFDGKVISLFVDRDPRDVYLLTNVVFPKLNKYMPNNGDVKAFVKYYRSIHQPKVIDNRVYYVQYEDLIYDYENTVKKICEMLPELEWEKGGKYFKPEYSINNTQLWKKYPEFNEDIKYIEQELPDMLYDFNNKATNVVFSKVDVQPFENQTDN